MEKAPQIIDKPSRSINQVLPFKLRKKFATQSSDGKIQRINLMQLKKRLSSRHKKMSIYLEQKFVTYELGHINDTCRQKINKAILENIQVRQAQLMLVNLVNETFLSKMSEGLKSLHYDSSKYSTLLHKIQEVFKQILPIPKKRVLVGQGQISQLLYVFFENCYEQPFSLCCNFIIYLQVQIKQNGAKSLILKKHKLQQDIEQVCSVKICLFCSRCNIKILQLYGQKKQAAQSSFSPKKIHEILQIQQQRKKVKMSIMIGSGRFKKHRIDDFQNSKVNIGSFIDQHRYQSVKIKRKYDKTERLQPITGSISNQKAFFSQFLA